MGLGGDQPHPQGAGPGHRGRGERDPGGTHREVLRLGAGTCHRAQAQGTVQFLHRNALVATGHAGPLAHDLQRHHGEREREQCDVQHREAGPRGPQERPEGRGAPGRAEQHELQRPAVRAAVRREVGAQGEERGVGDRPDAGPSGEQIHREDEDRVDGREAHGIGLVGRDGAGVQHDEEHGRGERPERRLGDGGATDEREGGTADEGVAGSTDDGHGPLPQTRWKVRTPNSPCGRISSTRMVNEKTNVSR